MKAKLMALILTAGLGITGLAGTAQAAGTSTKFKCKHQTVHYYEKVTAKFYNGHDHVSTYETGYKCTTEGCSYTILVHEEYRYEPHDYEQVYSHDGSIISTCLNCHDTFYW